MQHIPALVSLSHGLLSGPLAESFLDMADVLGSLPTSGKLLALEDGVGW